MGAYLILSSGLWRRDKHKAGSQRVEVTNLLNPPRLEGVRIISSMFMKVKEGQTGSCTASTFGLFLSLCRPLGSLRHASPMKGTQILVRSCGENPNLGRAETCYPHHDHHGLIILVHSIHGFPFFLVTPGAFALYAGLWHRRHYLEIEHLGRTGYSVLTGIFFHPRGRL